MHNDIFTLKLFCTNTPVSFCYIQAHGIAHVHHINSCKTHYKFCTLLINESTLFCVPNFLQPNFVPAFRTMAPLMTTALLGFAVGPALGGLVAETYGLHAPFLITAGGMMMGAASALVFLPETLQRRQPKTEQLKESISQAATQPAAVSAAATSVEPPQGPHRLQGQDNVVVDAGIAESDDSVGGGLSLPTPTSADAELTPSVWQQWKEMLRVPSLQGINAVVFMSGFAQVS